jgi:hypothetical protein
MRLQNEPLDFKDYMYLGKNVNQTFKKDDEMAKPI